LPFGEQLAQQKAAGFSTTYRFTGKEFDVETGLYYYGARYYDPTIGIFHGVDPLAEQGPEYSPYVYTLNNPIRYIDPDGRWPDNPGSPWSYLIEGFRQYGQAIGSVVDKVWPTYEIGGSNKTSIVSETKAGSVKTSTSVTVSESYFKVTTQSLEESFKYGYSPIKVESGFNEQSTEASVSAETTVRGLTVYGNDKLNTDKKGTKNTTSAGVKVLKNLTPSTKAEAFGEGFCSYQCSGSTQGKTSAGVKVGGTITTSSSSTAGKTTVKTENKSSGYISAFWSWFN
jgi:RHS repeat-associated protein